MKDTKRTLLCFCLDVIINSFAIFGFINILCITFYIKRDITGVSIISFIISIFYSYYTETFTFVKKMEKK